MCPYDIFTSVICFSQLLNYTLNLFSNLFVCVFVCTNHTGTSTEVRGLFVEVWSLMPPW